MITIRDIYSASQRITFGKIKPSTRAMRTHAIMNCSLEHSLAAYLGRPSSADTAVLCQVGYISKTSDQLIQSMGLVRIGRDGTAVIPP